MCIVPATGPDLSLSHLPPAIQHISCGQSIAIYYLKLGHWLRAIDAENSFSNWPICCIRRWYFGTIGAKPLCACLIAAHAHQVELCGALVATHLPAARSVCCIHMHVAYQLSSFTTHVAAAHRSTVSACCEVGDWHHQHPLGSWVDILLMRVQIHKLSPFGRFCTMLLWRCTAIRHCALVVGCCTCSAEAALLTPHLF